MRIGIIPDFLKNPWVLFAGACAIGYTAYQSSKKNRRRLREAKEELIEQQRTIDRLRAEVARNRPRAEPA
jgi:hypothetical protein